MLSVFMWICQLFGCLLWKNVYSHISFAQFLIGSLGRFCHWVVWVTFILWVLTPYQICGMQIFFLPRRLFFHFVDGFPSLCRSFYFDVNVLVYFLLLCLCPWCQIRKKNYCQDQCQGAEWQPMFSFRSFMVLGLTFIFNSFSVDFCAFSPSSWPHALLLFPQYSI